MHIPTQLVYNYLRTTHNKQPHDIILYGQSVGSGPSVHLAANTPNVGGLILHSPLASGVRVLHPDWKRWPACADIFPNHTLMPRVMCPTLVMHVRFWGGRLGPCVCGGIVVYDMRHGTPAYTPAYSPPYVLACVSDITNTIRTTHHHNRARKTVLSMSLIQNSCFPLHREQ